MQKGIDRRKNVCYNKFESNTYRTRISKEEFIMGNLIGELVKVVIVIAVSWAANDDR